MWNARGVRRKRWNHVNRGSWGVRRDRWEEEEGKVLNR
jgi:hypothetical protein